MKDVSRHIGTLNIIERLPNSTNGNPRFLLQVSGATFRTAVDSSHGYEVQNYEGKRVEVTIGTHYGKATLISLKAA